MKPKVIIKGIINYIFAMVFATIFALFLNANVGWFILLALILAPIVSVFLAWLSGRFVAVSCEMESELLSKGDKCDVTVLVRNNSIFPTPPIEISMTNEPGVRCEEPNILVSVLSKTQKCFEVTFKAKICGLSHVGIEKVRVTDYLGLFSFPIRKSNSDDLKKKVAVIPNIAEISAKDDMILKAMQVSMHADDSEDTVESVINVFGGFPGYDNRDYVPGDPLKRINWKQSAKRDKLLVRLDDEMASQSIGLVLDSVFKTNEINVDELTSLSQYRDCQKDEILPKIAEDAIENALGIMQVLVRHDYTVNFYAYMNNQFIRYDIEDENDLESVRLELAYYSFSQNTSIERFPREDSMKKNSGAFIFSTPNSYAEASIALEGMVDNLYTTIYSAVEEARKQAASVDNISWNNLKTTTKVNKTTGEKILGVVKTMAVPYLLALLLSTQMFAIFEVPFLSFWTVFQILVCAGVFALCEYTNKHKIIGGMIITVSALLLLSGAARIVFSRGYGLDYMHWFLSGGESVETTTRYLLTIIMVFTTFFALVTFYFVRILYRTSFLMLISLIPAVAYVKVMQDIDMVPMVLITVLNITAFLLNSRTRRDAGKKIEGYIGGLVSLTFYLILLVLAGLAAPEQDDAKYYYIFENLFLGGNVSEEIPEEYSVMNEYSGNADGFGDLNNRKLYEIRAFNLTETLYMKRQNFDLYDFEYDRWYSAGEFSEPVITPKEWAEEKYYLNLSTFSEALQCVEKYEPGFLEKYGLQYAVGDYEVKSKTLNVVTTNFPSEAYIVPPNILSVFVIDDQNNDMANTYITENGEFQRVEGLLFHNLNYNVSYYDDKISRDKWISLGGSDMDYNTSEKMLQEMIVILEENEEEEHLRTVLYHENMLADAIYYKGICAENTELIPEKVKDLALEITKDCTYEWEKAQALQNYFYENDFVYDLSYDAKDDSVEYFLFKAKRGTCSDYASAYALMARSVGLIVKYAEGFVPQQEYSGQYVVRTDCGHAYPEVYIPNVGFVVYEATNPARNESSIGQGSGFMSYFMTAGFRLIIIFGTISAGIIFILFVHTVISPFIREAYFNKRLSKAEPLQAVIMMYKRIRDKHFVNDIANARARTPYEYAVKFEKKVKYDISSLVYMLEQGIYSYENLTDAHKEQAEVIYKGAKAAIKELRKEQKKKRIQK